MRVFPNADVLFSAPLGGEVFHLLLLFARRGGLELYTGPLCLMEAEFNPERKRSQVPSRRTSPMRQVRLVPEPKEGSYPTEGPLRGVLVHLPGKDRPVPQAALRAQAHVSLTGGIRHFDPLMGREDLPLRVLSPGDFIRQARPCP